MARVGFYVYSLLLSSASVSVSFCLGYVHRWGVNLRATSNHSIERSQNQSINTRRKYVGHMHRPGHMAYMTPTVKSVLVMLGDGIKPDRSSIMWGDIRADCQKQRGTLEHSTGTGLRRFHWIQSLAVMIFFTIGKKLLDTRGSTRPHFGHKGMSQSAATDSARAPPKSILISF